MILIDPRFGFKPRHLVVLAGIGAGSLSGVAFLHLPGSAPTSPRAAVMLGEEPRLASTAMPPAEIDQGDAVRLRRAHLPGPYPVDAVRVIDGDTFEARIRIWFGQEITTLVRIRGIDAPELKARCGEEKRGAEAARDALSRLLTQGRPSIADVALDKYAGRILASVLVAASSESRDVAADMIAAGLARPYDGGKRAGWCDVAVARRG
jgi:endonuclease YncB( thermonuclease family)